MAEATRVKTPCDSSTPCSAKRVHDGGEHAHVVGRGPLDTLGGALNSAEDVAAADNDANLNAEFLNVPDFIGDAAHRGADADRSHRPP